MDDPAEAAADRLADRVVDRMLLGRAAAAPAAPATRVRRNGHGLATAHRSVAHTERPPIEAAGPDGGVLDDDTAGRIRRASGRGRALDDGLRPSLESAFGTDLGRVNVHANSPLAGQVGAVAFAHGHDIHFAPGAYRPDTRDGLHTLSHEVAHVLQQSDGAPVNRIHRLMDAAQFRKVSYEGKLRVRGSTAAKIDELLTEYDTLRARGANFDLGANGIDRAITILTHIQQDIQLWNRSHAQDTGRATQRAGLQQLDTEVRDELKTLNDTRAAYAQHGVEKAPLTITDNTFKAQMEGSASSVFEKLAPVIGAAVPSPGDSADIEASVKIPVDPSSSAYVGLRLNIAAARNDRTSTKLSLTVGVSGGAKVLNAVDLGAELTAFIEAHGKDPKSALQLLSWGWYRRVRESLLPREIANFMWGGSTGSVGWVRSEDWAASVERENFVDVNDPNFTALSSGVGSDSTTNAYVRTGGGLSGSASGSIGVASLEGSLGVSGGTHYDVDTINARKGRRGGQLGQAEQMPDRGKTTYLGTHFTNFEASAGVSAGPFSGSLSAKVEALRDDAKKEWRLEYLSGSLSAGATLPLNAEFASKFGTQMVALAPQVFALMKKLGLMMDGKDKSGKPEAVGEIINTGDSVAQAFGAWGSEPFELEFEAPESEAMDSLSDSLGKGASLNTDETGATISLDIAFGKNFMNRSAPVAVDLTLNSERAMQLDVSIASFKITRGRRLMRFKWEAGTWKPKVD